MEPWYFAYGSNLWTDQMIERTGPLAQGERRPRIARLAGYRLAFTRQGDDGQAFANILCPGEGVLGVIYSLDPAALESLDRYERGYFRQSVEVTDEHGEALPAVAYVVKPELGTAFGKPSAEYLQRILAGARQQGLPKAYIANIVAIAEGAEFRG